jgi:hypothetical protein
MSTPYLRGVPCFIYDWLWKPGDMPPWGKGPVQGKIHNGPDYINNDFPLIDKFKTCTVVIHKPSEGSPHERDAAGAGDSGEEEEEGEEEGEEEEEEEDADTTEEKVEEEEDKEDAEEENEEEEVGRRELHNRRQIREMKEAQNNADDPAQVEQRELAAAEKELSPFADVFHIAAVVAGIVLMVLGVAALARRSRKKKHKL